MFFVSIMYLSLCDIQAFLRQYLLNFWYPFTQSLDITPRGHVTLPPYSAISGGLYEQVFMQAPFLYQVSPSRIHWFTLTTNFVGTSLPSSTQDRLVSKVPPRPEVPKTSPHTVPREPGARVTGVEASCDSAWILASSAKTRSMYLVLPTDAPQWLVHNPVHTIAEKQWDKVSPALLSCWWKRSWTCSPNPTLSVSEYGPVSKPVVLAGIPQSCRRFQSTSQCTESNAFLRST